MKQLVLSWQTFFPVLFFSVAMLCLCANYLYKYCRRIGRQRNSGTEEVFILPLQYSSDTTSSVLHKCASDNILLPSLIQPPPTTSENENGKQRRQEEVVLAENNVCFQDLPSDVLLHIISFLTFESIGPLVRVCKSWSGVLRDPDNIDLLLGRKTRGRPNHNPIFLFGDDNYEHHTTELYLLDSMRTSTYHFSKLPVQKQMLIAASCSGFICCCYHGRLTDLTLCNPLTQEFVKLPELPKIGLTSCPLFGLGIDLTRKKSSKLVRVLCHLKDTTVFECNVYTFGSNNWRSVEVPKFQPCGDGILYNWTLYWMALKDPSSLLRRILTFDLEKEKFSLVSPPNREKGQEPRLSYMMNLGNELCYVSEYEGEIGIHVLEDDAKMVWSLRYRISNRKMFLCGVWANDALFVEESRGKFYYCPDKMKVQEICVPSRCKEKNHFCFVSGQFFPNLMSPKLLFL